MSRLDHMADKFEEYVIFIALSIMSLAILAQIINRSFLGRPFPYGEEIARYMMVWATMMGTSAGVKTGAHIGVDVLVRALPRKAGLLWMFLINVVALAFYVFVGYLSTKIVYSIQGTGQISPALQMPMWLAYLALPVGFALCVFRQIQLILTKLRECRERDTEEKRDA